MHQLQMTGHYNIYLVLLSLVIAIFASYTSFDLAYRVRTSSGWVRKAWLMSGAVAMGGGIWSMHFIAMLAFYLPQPITYELFLLSVSVLVAFAASIAGFYFASRSEGHVKGSVIGGLIMGFGICGMHYIGMEAMKGVNIEYDPLFFGLSVLVAMGTSIVALMLVFHLRDFHHKQTQRWGSSFAMGAAIAGMHFTGMKAAIFSPSEDYRSANHLLVMNESMVAVCIAAFSLVMLVLVLVSSYVDQKFKMQAEMQRVEKLRVLGDLTSAFAHEIRNPMQVNRGFLQLLNERPLPQDVKNYIRICIEEMDRANDIINDYLSFAKPNAEHLQPIDVAEQISIAIHIISSHAMMNHVKIASDLEQGHIWGEAQKLTQSLINIMENGIEAMPFGGTLFIRCRNQSQDVVIDIIDEGIGMTKEQIQSLGHPSYSLKEKGTGLGLMVSYRFIDAFGGRIHVTSEKGKGTTFSIRIPRITSWPQNGRVI